MSDSDLVVMARQGTYRGATLLSYLYWRHWLLLHLGQLILTLRDAEVSVVSQMSVADLVITTLERTYPKIMLLLTYLHRGGCSLYVAGGEKVWGPELPVVVLGVWLVHA